MKRIITKLRRLGGDTRGVAAIEFGFIAPFLLFALVAAADLGIGLLLRMELTSAARVGSQYALVSPQIASDLSDVELASINALPAGSGILNFRQGATSTATVIEECVDGTTPDGNGVCAGGVNKQVYINVTVTRDWEPLIPYPGINLPMPISSSSVIRKL